ncbi:amino acid adenylation domain-containing protein [Rhodococcus sp. D-6]|uniref:Amino acid adenylation domain-containing protein n=1 Tax=Rhodococcus sp. D-6 TaxID=1387842 RepID=A0AAU7URC3_9NOCA
MSEALRKVGEQGAEGNGGASGDARPAAAERRRPRRRPERRGARAALLPQLIAAAVERDPSATAVVEDDRSLTYAELDEASSRLARYLIGLGVGPEDVVALAIARSIDSVLATWAVAKTGAAFVPVDPNYPADRVEHMTVDSGAALGLTLAENEPALPSATRWIALDDPAIAQQLAALPSEPVSFDERVRTLRVENTAYIIYTSGSTGRPKGVVVTHSGLGNFCTEQVERYALTSDSRTLHFASPSFDASILELLLAIGASSTMVIAPTSVYGGEEFAELVVQQQVTHAFVTPAALASVDPTGLGVLDCIVVGGEACPPDLVERWAPGRRFFNGYGPTETTIMTNISDPLAPGEQITIGAPIRNTTAHVLDTRLHAVPAGVTGELYLSGPGVARGYHRRPELTAARFVAAPGGTRMYRSGDLVRGPRDAASPIVYIGRNDFQVKVRGFRIELGEIDAVLASSPAVDFAATLARTGPSGQAQLVAYVHAAPDATVDLQELSALAAERLPAHMVPSAIVPIDEIPLSPTGKLDRDALPDPGPIVTEFRAPETGTEIDIAAVFADVLGLDSTRVGLDDDFFDLGGNSLIATRVAARLSERLGVRVPARLLFEGSTVAALAVMVEPLAGDDRAPLVAQERPERVPLSLAQQRMWFLNRFEPESAVNNIPGAIRLTGVLDVEALRSAVVDVLGRHESLRTIYPDVDGVGYQQVLPVDEVVPDLTPVPVAESDLIARATEIVGTGFDVTTQVPFRARLFAVTETGTAAEHVLVLVVHHIASDGFSMGPLTRDVVTAYAARVSGDAPQWEPLPVQYADFAIWQREVLGSEDDPESIISSQVAFWRETLAGLPEQLDLPADRPRPAVASYRGASHRFVLDSELRSAVRDLARRTSTTEFMVVHAALAVLLARLSGTDDIAIGTPVAGRGDAALDDLVGMFVNTLVLRTRVEGGESFEQVLGRVRGADLEAFGHADLPFERLVEIIDPERSTARHPLFQVLLAFQNLDAGSLELPGLTVSALDVDVALAKFDLQVTVSDDATAEGYLVELTYATDLFDARTMESFAERLARILTAVVTEPALPVGDVALLDDAERTDVLATWNATEHALGDAGTLVDLFAEQVRRSPDAVAVEFEGETLTYGEFSERVNRLARHLISLGVGPDARVGLAMRRSLDLLVGMYAVVTAGGAYVPIDPDQPEDRNGYILDIAAPVVVLTTERDGFSVPATASVPSLAIDTLDLSATPAEPVTDADRVAPLRPSNTAYSIFTSGSTGRPKGVAVAHASVVNQIRWITTEYGIGPDDVVLQKTPFTFDVSVWELFGTLAVGARMVIAVPDGHRDPAYLGTVIRERAVTATSFVPSMLAVFAASVSPDDCASLRTVLVAGEAFPLSVAEQFSRSSDAELHNLYGPTEATVHATARPVAGTTGGSVAMGAPVWNTRAYVLDSRLSPVPAGVVGELYLAGVQVARGYVGRPDLTAERFVASPFGEGERLYRTGDLVRWSNDRSGDLEYLGRTDFQVKLRGLRIELGEIETALLDHTGVSQAAAQVRRDQLVAYVVPAPNTTFDRDAAQAALSAVLPAYMVPSQFVVLDEMPLGSSGKVDRKALPDPVFEARGFRAPTTPVEEVVAGVFADVLGVDRVGLDDDFFALGGNSLIATQVVARLGSELGTVVPVRVLFEAPGVAALAARVEQSEAQGRTPLVAQERPERVPLSLAQQRMWFLNRFDTESSVNNIPVAVRLTGALDLDALRAAVQDLLARHEVLRTVYPEVDGRPYQLILPVAEAAPDIDVESATEDDLLQKVTAVVSRGFDVTTEIPLRARLFELSERDHVLVFVVHHISADGWSISPLTRDVMTAYMSRAEGQVPGWAPLPVQYADFAIWQRDVLGDEDDAASLLAAQADFWKRTLAGLPDELNLPMDRPRPAVQSFAGGMVGFTIDADTHRGLAALARRTGTTMFMVVHTALAVFLARMADTDDVAIGTPIAGRGEAEVDDLIGMFVNTLVLRSRVDTGEGFSDLLARVREADLEAFAHADIPFERLVEIIDPERSTARHPLFQVVLSFQNFREAALELPGLTVSGVPFDVDTAKFDLSLILREQYDEEGEPAGIGAEFSYATALFDRRTVEEFARRFSMLLTGALDTPEAPVGDLAILDVDEFDRLIHVRGGHVTTGGSFSDILTRGGAMDPDAVAVRYEGRSITYRELDETSSRLARLLIERGAGPENFVAVSFPRSYEMVLSVWAIAKTGAAHLPVDPTYPDDRVRYMLDDSGATLGITSSEFVGGLPDDAEWLLIDDPAFAADVESRSAAPITDADRVRPIRVHHPAYLIYTSGSTGKPKGVVVTHAGLGGVVDTAADLYHLRAGHRSLHICSPSFDPSVLEWTATFSSGATLVIVPAGIIGGPDLAELLRAEGVTHVTITPAVLGTMDPTGLDSVETICVGGDVTTPELLAQWAAGRRYFNGYGPTEATIMTTFGRLQPGRPITIGSPTHGVSALVLDSRLRPVAAGMAGELYVAGRALARGYHRRNALTAERFVPNPYGEPGDRMYRTGDVVRWRPVEDRLEIEFVGRSDFQVKVRGFRIELGEIDAVLSAHESVNWATTVGRSTPSGATVLASYVLPVRGRTIDTAELTEFVSRSLPPHMVPSAIVVLDEVPLTPVGKLDRDALPEPVIEEREYRAPATPYEEIVARTYAEVLGVPRAGVDDDFFTLGGNSLIATRVAARISKALGVRVTVRELFESSTVAGLAAVVESLAGGDRIPLVPGPRPETIPLSFAQQRMWFLNRFDSASAANNIPVALRLRGTLDADALGAAVADLVERHEPLRTIYPDRDGVGSQLVLPVSKAIPVLRVEEVQSSEIESRVIHAVMTGFDITVEVPWRLELLRTGDEYVLIIVVHHIAADGASMEPFVRDLVTAYLARRAGAVPGWEPLAVQYADFTLWQRSVLGDEDDPDSTISKDIAYWTSVLADLPDRLELPTDRPRPAGASGRGAVVEFEIDPALHEAVVELGRAAGCSPFMVFHAAFAVLLSRISGANDIAIGTPVAGRGEQALDDLIGMFVNTLVLRTTVTPERTFADVLREVRASDIDAFAHADLPFERLVEVLDPVRSAGHHPLFQVALFFQNMERPDLALPGLDVEPVDLGGSIAKFDLQLTVGPREVEGRPAGMDAQFTYATDLFDETTVRSLAARLVTVLESLTGDVEMVVGDVDLLAAPERHALTVEVNATERPVDAQTLLSRYRAQVASTPDSTAVVFGDDALTYTEFDARVNRLARHLISVGVGPESLVALGIRRSIDLVAAMYAVVTAGGAYVPLDPDHPADRISHILDTARPVCVLSTTADAGDLPAGVETILVDDPALPDHPAEPVREDELRGTVQAASPAYVIFTSGSTGRPKGVSVPHEAIVNQLEWMAAEYDISPGDVYLQKTATTFDVSLWGYFLPLRTGGTLVVATHDGHRDPAYVADAIVRYGVTLTDFVPSMLTVFAAHAPAGSCAGLRHVFVIGEALPPETVTAFRRLGDAAVHNLYGPTEAAVSATYWGAEDGDHSVPIGVPEANVQVYVLDSRLRPTPVGTPGELYLGGVQLARGYEKRPDLTSDRFVASPLGVRGSRMYRTGDLVRWRRIADGALVLDYLGRTDFQVKFRGQRIELGEIETALLGCAEVSQAVALVVPTPTGEQLVAYVVPAPGHTVDKAVLLDAVRSVLPSYMVPSAVVVLDAFPLNTSGKLDRKALPEPVFEVREFRAPRSPIEEIVANVYAEVLGVPRVGVDDDFFELGGNSLIATRVVSRLREKIGVEVRVQWLFAETTVEALAQRIAFDLDSGEAFDPSDDNSMQILLPLRTRGSGKALFCVHPLYGLAWTYSGLTHFVRDRPVYGVQSRILSEDGYRPKSLAEMTARYVEEIRIVQPEGPYHLMGWSLGGVLAHEMAVRLQGENEQVGSLTMLDSRLNLKVGDFRDTIRDELAQIGVVLEDGDNVMALSDEHLEKLWEMIPQEMFALSPERFRDLYEGALHSAELIASHTPGVFEGDLLYFTAADHSPNQDDVEQQWSHLVTGSIKDVPVGCVHGAMMTPESLAAIGPVLDEYLRRKQM